ncbi:hypothetical protein ACFYUD_27480 [Nocardia tengchongensis]|uniref:hypothetical protein n=1 Tax=Nocardia tengchongensis TaxID=2055889 RepID=UPI00369F6FA4
MSTLTTTPAAVAPANAAMPSVHRRALITWLAVYPTITVALALLGPEMGGLPVFLKTLVLTVIVVPVSAYLLVPMLMKANQRLTARFTR